jgi:SAM-dependent methyltransferase
MMSFYAEDGERANYQEMLDEIEDEPEHDSSTVQLARHIAVLHPESILEVGCGDGRLYRALRRGGCEAHYTGVEVAEYVIERNRRRHPNADWFTASVYELPSEEESTDVVFAEFVLEHLVFPRQALTEMLRTVRSGGHLILVFPDFVEAGRLSSQVLGLSPTRTASEALKKGSVLDSLISLYDSRVRLPNALASARSEVGPFPVNIRPVCLTYPDLMFSDIDAVYIASKEEVCDWARQKGHKVTFPAGTEPPYNETAFLSIEKQ